MKKITKKQGFLIFIRLYMLLFLVLIIVHVIKRNFPIIKVGQTWEYTRYNENPFEKKTTYTYDVIDIKDGYTQYITNSKDTSSTSERIFRVNTLIKK